MEEADLGTQSRAVRVFAELCARVVMSLPFGLERLVPPTLLGFAVINGFTFGVDLALLTVFHGVWHWPVPIAVTVAYVLAFALSFVLNRAFNFRSHGAIDRQAAVYAVVIAINYAVFILGLGTWLAWLGVEYHVARIFAGACEAIFLYSAMRWIVFRPSATSAQLYRLTRARRRL